MHLWFSMFDDVCSDVEKAGYLAVMKVVSVL